MVQFRHQCCHVINPTKAEGMVIGPAFTNVKLILGILSHNLDKVSLNPLPLRHHRFLFSSTHAKLYFKDSIMKTNDRMGRLCSGYDAALGQTGPSSGMLH